MKDLLPKILIVDDDINICQMLERFLNRNSFSASYCTTSKRALEILSQDKHDLVLCDFRLPDATGKEILQQIKSMHPDLPVIIITGYSDVKIAVDVIKMGAYDYVTKPLLPDEILLMINKALASSGTQESGDIQDAGSSRAFAKPKPVSTGAKPRFIVGKSKEALHIQKQIELVAPTNYAVIIYGESGTGKESVAYNIHAQSNRRNKPFVAVDCGALTRELAGSELFGHEKGAFTGALQTKIGQFEMANGGTLFLDEIANLTYDVQVSLLRVIQEKKIRRIGSSKEIEVDTRILVASNEKLNSATSEGKFREDLYHRFNEFTIHLPPLRQRSDMMTFAEFFLKQANEELNKSVVGFDPQVEKIFKEYQWPGNLREMNNVVKRAVLLADKEIVSAETLPQEIVFQSRFNLIDDDLPAPAKTMSIQNQTPQLKSAALYAEYEMIMEVLKKANFNKSKAAKLLNIDRKTLYNKMKAFNLLNE